MSAQKNAPIIIKKKKVIAGGGHHGGAWKVAYADFVTAMMAFFLLMWLLNATTEKQRKGIADYFSPTIPINRISGGGDGSFGGDSVFTEETLARNGTGASAKHATSSDAARGDMGDTADSPAGSTEDKKLSTLQEALSGKSGESMVSPEARRHIVTRVTDEGLVVELFDLPGEPLFTPGTDTPTALLDELAGVVSDVFSLAENQVAVSGFTRSEAIVLKDNPVWNLSQSRGDALRRLLAGKGLNEARMQRVSGFADRKPAVPNPMAVRNNRVELILLRNRHRQKTGDY